MNVPRETIYDALFALGKTVTWTWNGDPQTWRITGRRLLDWSGVATQPAFFQRQLLERPTQQRSQGGGFGTTKWPLVVQWWVYLQAPNSDVAGNWPSTYSNTVMDAIDAVLQPPTRPDPITLRRGLPGQGQTLAAFNNGVPLVENVCIEGDVVEKDPIGGDSQIVLVIPLKISAGL